MNCFSRGRNQPLAEVAVKHYQVVQQHAYERGALQLNLVLRHQLLAIQEEILRVFREVLQKVGETRREHFGVRVARLLRSDGHALHPLVALVPA